MKKYVMLAFRLFLIAMIICTLTFTFYQSSLPKRESAEASQTLSERLEPYIPSTTPTGAFVHKNIREIAHFTEFFTLGAEVALYIIFFAPHADSSPKSRLRFCIYSLALSPIIPLLDETFQIFTNRGPEIVDVWLDTAGYVTASVIVFAVYYVTIYIMSRIAKAKKTAAQKTE